LAPETSVPVVSDVDQHHLSWVRIGYAEFAIGNQKKLINYMSL
jgi:hypothetical protein